MKIKFALGDGYDFLAGIFIGMISVSIASFILFITKAYSYLLFIIFSSVFSIILSFRFSNKIGKIIRKNIVKRKK